METISVSNYETKSLNNSILLLNTEIHFVVVDV